MARIDDRDGTDGTAAGVVSVTVGGEMRVASCDSMLCFNTKMGISCRAKIV